MAPRAGVARQRHCRFAIIKRYGAFTVDKIRAAGKIAGTLVTADELPYCLKKGVQNGL
jgi:hypothetical protein